MVIVGDVVEAEAVGEMAVYGTENKTTGDSEVEAHTATIAIARGTFDGNTTGVEVAAEIAAERTPEEI